MGRVREATESELVDHGVARRHRVAAREPTQPGGRFERVGRGLVGKRGVVLRQVRNEIGDDAGLGDDVTAEEFDATGVRLQQTR